MLNVVEGTSVTQHNAAASRSLSTETTTSARDLTPPHPSSPRLASPCLASPGDRLILDCICTAALSEVKSNLE